VTALAFVKFLCLLAAGVHAAHSIYRNLVSHDGSPTRLSAQERKPEPPAKYTPKTYKGRLPEHLFVRHPALSARTGMRPSAVLRSVRRMLPSKQPLPWQGSPRVIPTRLCKAHAAPVPSHKNEGFWDFWRSAWTHFTDISALCDYALESPLVLGHFLLVAFVEEMIWRVASQSILIEFLQQVSSALWASPPQWFATTLGIVIIAFLFSVSHKHFFENTWLVSAEFFGFAILLGLLYYWTSSFVLVVVIHALRDIEITFLEYQIRSEEIGDRETAAREVEQSLLRDTRMRRRPSVRELLFQVPAFYLSCFLGYWEYGAFTRELISPLHIALGIAAGHLIFGASLLITLHSAETA